VMLRARTSCPYLLLSPATGRIIKITTEAQS
jgi:hypothetical protein